MPPQSQQQNKPRRPAPVAPPQKPEPKLSPGAWYLLFLAAVFLDLAQIGADLIGIGLVVNPFLDIVVGLSLFLLFFLKRMLNWRLTASLLVAFTGDELSDGALPMWAADIAFAWLITDGAGALGNIPLVGKAAQKAVQTAASKKLPGAVPPSSKP